MTPRSLFNIIIKIFGIFFIKNIVEAIPEFISTIVFLVRADSDTDSFKETIVILIGTSTVLIFYIFVCFQLLFKTNKIVDILKLDKGFSQDTFTFDISSSSIITIALIVTAASILTNEIPNLCESIYRYAQQRTIIDFSGKKPDYSHLFFQAAKIVIALLLLGERKRIVEFIELRQRKSNAS
jgi:hypothetical protein